MSVSPRPLPASLSPHPPLPVKFGALDPTQTYDEIYAITGKHNGEAPDSFILSLAKESFPDATSDGKPVCLWDIGAGDGRNSLALANSGFNVIASEPSEVGQFRILQQTGEKNLIPHIRINGEDVLSPLGVGGKKRPIHLAFLSRVTQHFTLKDLQKMFQTVTHRLAPNGRLTFDALIRKPHAEDEAPPAQLVHDGAAHFRQQDVLTAAKSQGLSLQGIHPFDEPEEQRPKYMNSHYWGHADTEKSIVEHKWFVFGKPAQEKSKILPMQSNIEADRVEENFLHLLNTIKPPKKRRA